MSKTNHSPKPLKAKTEMGGGLDYLRSRRDRVMGWRARRNEMELASHSLIQKSWIQAVDARASVREQESRRGGGRLTRR